MPSRSHERNLRKRQAQRMAERRRRRRRQVVYRGIASVVVLAVVGFLAYKVFNRQATPSAATSPTPSATASPSASPSPSPSPSASPVAVACGGKVPAASKTKKKTYKKPPPMTISASKTYTMTMVTSCGTIVIRLDQADAPRTVNSLVFLTDHGFYNGLTIFRIAKGFVIQGGDPNGNGSGGPGYSTVDPPPANATYPPGTLAMAKGTSDPPGTAGSQFFFVTGKGADTSLAPPGHGPQYAIVGHIVGGMNVMQKIAALQITPQSSANDGPPVDMVYIVKVTITVS